MRKPFKVLMLIAFILYLFLGVLLMLSSNNYRFNSASRKWFLSQSNLIPCKTIIFYVTNLFSKDINFDIAIKNLLGNVFLFFPLGFFIPGLFSKIRFVFAFCFGILFLVVIEILQAIFMMGIFDIDDIILNMLGYLLGYFLWKKIICHLCKGGRDSCGGA